MDVRDLSGRWALVTGAGSGIGRATALAFAARGAHLALCDIDESGLAETIAQLPATGAQALGEQVDVASADAVAAFAGRVHQQTPAVDILMNNAGIGIGARMLETPLPEWERIVSINLMGVVHGCQSFVPRMVERGRGGHVVNVASAAGYAATQLLAAYSATKFAVVGLSEALREEVAASGVGVTALCPGLINTPITRNSRMFGVADTRATRSQLVEGYQRRGYGPERVAAGVLKAIQRNRAVAPVSPEAWLLYWLKRFAPNTMRWLSSKASAHQLTEMARAQQEESS